MRIIISLICLLMPILTFAESADIRENAPDRHIVVKGDTLWDISATFFKDPWKWQKIWGLNKETIKNPHWIYPGDVVLLDRVTGSLHIGDTLQPPPQVNSADTTSSGDVAGKPNTSISSLNSLGVYKLQPRARELRSDHDAIPAIPIRAIGPFLSKPLVVENVNISSAPTLIGAYEHRTLLGTNDLAYVSNLPGDKGSQWQVYRLGKTFVDPDTEEVLGHEVVYLGDGAVEKFAPISELRITKVVSEIAKGDYLSQSTQEFAGNFEPHAPTSNIVSKIISIYGGVNQAGQNAIVTLNKGKRDGIENGHVLALYLKGDLLKGKSIFKSDDINLPNVRYGLIFVFRTFQKVSYALVLQTRLPVQLLDTAQTP